MSLPHGANHSGELSGLLADLLRRAPVPLSAETLVQRLTDACRTSCGIRALRLDREAVSHRPPVSAYPSLVVPLPLPPDMPPAVLTALFEPGDQPVHELRLWLESVACVLSACLLAEQTVLAPRTASTPDRGHAVTAHGLLGHSVAMTMVRDRIARYAAATEPVLILGESGTGKELVARAIHRQSARGRGPFVAVNCGGLVGSLLEAEMFGIESGTATGVRGRKGKFELARGGTLFLDEVADLSPAGQAVLLRVLQEREVERVGADRPIPVDVRVVAATNQPLRQRVADQRFREDLYYRLQVLPLSMPPLRERPGDVVELACAFLDRDSRRWPWDLQPAAADVLAACDWPGNVRQLESVIALIRTLAPTPAIDVDLVHSALQGFEVPIPDQREPGPLTLREAAARHASEVLEACHGNKTLACRRLGISINTLRAYLRPVVRPPPQRKHLRVA